MAAAHGRSDTAGHTLNPKYPPRTEHRPAIAVLDVFIVAWTRPDGLVGLMCEYLFAQFTLKRSADEGLSVEQLAKVAAWEAVIVEVTEQEMLHLALATNLLTAIGAAPHLHRPNFPLLSRWYPPGCRSRCSGSASGPCATSSARR